VSLPSPPSWLSAAEVAALFGVSVRTVRRRIADETWPSTRVPGTRARRFSPADVEAIGEMAAAPSAERSA
jgi:excisionase family DNA binding protein